MLTAKRVFYAFPVPGMAASYCAMLYYIITVDLTLVNISIINQPENIPGFGDLRLLLICRPLASVLYTAVRNVFEIKKENWF
jgi:hypothetical protein